MTRMTSLGVLGTEVGADKLKLKQTWEDRPLVASFDRKQ